MNLPESAVRRSVTVYMLIFGLLLLGGISLSRLSLDLLPDIKLPAAVIMTEYPGAGPSEIEKMVTEPLEGVLSTLSNLDKVQSQCMPGSSVVVLFFDWGTDMDFATLEVREKLDLVRSFLPSGVKDPIIFKLDPSLLPVIQAGMSIGGSGTQDASAASTSSAGTQIAASEGDINTTDPVVAATSTPATLADLTYSAAEIVKPRLERLPGVAWVVIGGGVSSEVHVLMDPAKMEAHGLSIDYVAQILMGENLGITAGTIQHGEKELRITTKGEFKDLEQIANTPIVTPKGSLVCLKDISQVKQSFSDVTQKSSMNGVPSVGISIFKQTGANTVQVAEAVHKEFESLKKELPENTQINTVFDQSEFIKLSIDSVKSNALIGAFLAILIIFLFLRNVRTTLVIAISIPISIITTFIMMYFAGFTLNMLSLGGLALGVGMIVDDSIVVLESIFRYREAGYSAWESATAGAQEVAMAVTASTFTNVVVFLPVIFVEGIASQIFKELALTVSFALLASLLVALTLVPVLANRLVQATTSPDEKTLYGRIMTAWGRALDALDSGYRNLLEWSMNHRKQVLLSVLGIFIFSIVLYPPTSHLPLARFAILLLAK
jgi:HAE1 family hydrophobic/amphiphilic exporter-1